MNQDEANVVRGCVATEGDELYYEVRGQGTPLLMIPGGGGDGGLYLAVADILCDDYKVILYDRRANARSTMNHPQNFEINQQSRDAVAVLRAVSEESAYVFGNSSGAIIALDMAKTQPQAIKAVVVHEAPAARLHPNAMKWQRFFAGVYKMAFTLGPSLAGIRFFFGIQVHGMQLMKAHIKGTEYAKRNKESCGQSYLDTKIGTEFLVKQELLPVTNYLPDTEQIKQNKVKVFIAVGEWALSKKTWLSQISQILAEKLGCELAVFPGHHGAYMDRPEDFAATLRTVLHKAEDNKPIK